MTILEIMSAIGHNGFVRLKKSELEFYQKCFDDVKITITLDLVTDTLYISGEKVCYDVIYHTKAYATFDEFTTRKDVDICLQHSIKTTVNSLNEKGKKNDKTKN
jgi:hypothetical protein